LLHVGLLPGQAQQGKKPTADQLSKLLPPQRAALFGHWPPVTRDHAANDPANAAVLEAGKKCCAYRDIAKTAGLQFAGKFLFERRARGIMTGLAGNQRAPEPTTHWPPCCSTPNHSQV
jgi:hypothetical protein